MMTCAFRLAILATLLVGVYNSAPAAEPDRAQMLADRIDARLQVIWKAHGVEAAPPADSAIFLRRASLDLLGRIPTAAEARAFVRDDSPELRRATIHQMVDNSASTQRLARVLRRTWFPQTDVAPYQYLTIDTQKWLAAQLQQRTPLNEIARQLIAVSFAPSEASIKAAVDAVPRTLVEANDHRAERMAANATGAFLGIDISCAQCHDHPFGSWTQDQFWQTAAFFTRTTSAPDQAFSLDDLSIAVPETNRQVSALLFTGDAISADETQEFQSGREAFAAWIAGDEHRYFARRIVNQIWTEYFGSPLQVDGEVEPADSRLSDLLDELAEELATSNFDLRRLTEALVLTRAYQLAPPQESTFQSSPNLFAAAAVRGMTGEQLFDSLCVAAGRRPLRDDLDSAAALEQRRAFCQQFRIAGSAAAERSMTQSLAMMNGAFTRDLVDPMQNPTLQAMDSTPFLSAKDRVETLFWATVGHPPTAVQWSRLTEAGLLADDPGARAERHADLFWILVNSVEFSTNH
ncbi:DUF1549 and DUF1553 domain-containing protein [Blastopirellula sp. J2-11]|uniref:DUF1549 and DUF1553 domain-containing protein n=1 Tax=Blastopirellula sp. J2-11 TaxID=2943192 RepID=UPI0021C9C0CA|nr:DUF1549 and DUF1553 domain-containing protein [Blastopirellula sp. J2-11]UUO09035.1 DUF1549 and DUF1553 domain-containing protein [Blastopirellula sp. J2-11]